MVEDGFIMLTENLLDSYLNEKPLYIYIFFFKSIGSDTQVKVRKNMASLKSIGFKAAVLLVEFATCFLLIIVILQ